MTVALRELSTPAWVNKYRLIEESSPRDFLVDVFGEQHMSVLVVVIEVLIGVLDFIGVVRHSKFNEYYMVQLGVI